MKKRLVLLLVLPLLALSTTMAPAASAPKCGAPEIRAAAAHVVKLLEQKGRAAFGEIKKFRLCGGGYVYLLDDRGVSLMHPFMPRIVGTNRLGVRDDTGKRFNVEALNKLKTKNEVWIPYRFNKPGGKTFFDKCGYFRKVKTKDGVMIVSTGRYGKCPR
ncbi:MAG: cache domain-containing protein [Proteobacteria bacterium]|nr:cache domain-containing protein [Pseudomonadota bacterium]